MLINGRPAHRLGDMVKHCGGTGYTILGSSNVIVGECAGLRLAVPHVNHDKKHRLDIRLLGHDNQTPVRNRRIVLVSSSGKTYERMSDNLGNVSLKDIEPDTFDVYLDDDFSD